MNKTLATLLTILLTAVIVGGGVYFWQQSQLESLQEEIEELQSENEESKDEIESIEDKMDDNKEETSSLEGDYVNEKYRYSLTLPSNFDVYTEGYDNDGIEDESTVWVGTDQSFWTNGFYIRVLDTDLDSAYDEILTLAVENCEREDGRSEPFPGTECNWLPYYEDTQVIDGLVAKKITYGAEIGYNITKYYIEANNYIFEIQVVETNDEAQDVIQKIQFAN